MTSKFVALLFAAVLIFQNEPVHAQRIRLLAAGPSSVSEKLAKATVNGRIGASSHHWTGSAQLISKDSTQKSRDGNLWVAWSGDGKNVWAYFSLDSGEETHATNATAKYKLRLDAVAASRPGGNQVAGAQFKYGDRCPGEEQKGTTCDAGSLPKSVAKALSSSAVSIVDYDPTVNAPSCHGKCGGGEIQELQEIGRLASDPAFIGAH